MSFLTKKKLLLFLLIPIFSLILFGFVFVVRRGSSVKAVVYLSSIVLIRNFRENFASIFVFGNYDQANWHLTLSQKRLAEAQKLFIWKDFVSSQKFILKSAKESNLAKSYLKKAADSGEDVNYLEKMIEEIENKQSEILPN